MVIEKSEDPKAFREFEQSGWEANFGGYDRHFSSVTAQVVEPMLDTVGVTADMHVLDLCCGAGMLAGRAAARGASAVGLDFSRQAVLAAQEKFPEAEFVQGDAEALSFDDKSFDAAVCGLGIIHVPNPASALSEVRRVLRPGGWAAFSVWQAPRPENGFGLLLGAIKAHGDLNVSLPHGPDIFQFSDPVRFKVALEETGFGNVDTTVAPQTWQVEGPDDMVTALIEGTVRMRALYLAQTESARDAIETALAEGISRFPKVGDGYAVPMPAIIGWGSR